MFRLWILILVRAEVNNVFDHIHWEMEENWIEFVVGTGFRLIVWNYFASETFISAYCSLFTVVGGVNSISEQNWSQFDLMDHSVLSLFEKNIHNAI